MRLSDYGIATNGSGKSARYIEDDFLGEGFFIIVLFNLKTEEAIKNKKRRKIF